VDVDPSMSALARLLILAGMLLVVAGVVLALAGRIPRISWIGRLPGDFTFRRDGLTIYLPLATCLLVSLVLSLLLNVFRR
jgi:hypothetical protein